MKCPESIADSLLEIIRMAALRIRMEGEANRAESCAIEADHIHNLPNLVTNYSDELLAYYIEIEVPSFIRKRVGGSIEMFEPQWAKLRTFLHDNRKK